MILLQRTDKSFGAIDGSRICPDLFASMPLEKIAETALMTEAGTVALGELFEVSTDREPSEPFLVIDGDCSHVQGIGTHLKAGKICVLGDVGDNAASSMAGGTMVIAGNARDRVGMGMSDGFIYVAGDCRHSLASPLPGKKSGMRGGDILVSGNVGDRACERMRRGTVFVAGDVGDYCVPQMIAGSMVVMGTLGNDWGGGMRRGSLILGRIANSSPSASLSEARDFELSFLPLIWRHVENLQNRAQEVLNMAIAFSKTSTNRTARLAPPPIKIPSTRWVQRQIADLNCNGRGEVLVLKRISSPAYIAG
jgi:formylmethanofuran dehydrogenase subunit C